MGKVWSSPAGYSRSGNTCTPTTRKRSDADMLTVELLTSLLEENATEPDLSCRGMMGFSVDSAALQRACKA